jgi:large subunit ribosomal protein L10
MDRQTKEEAVIDLQKRLAGATAAVVTEYKGLTVEELNVLRRALREVSGEYRVAKNTLVALAIDGTPYLSLKELLAGQNGLVLGYGDVIGLTKVVARYASENQKFTIKGGVTQGQFLETASIQELATLPSREALLAQLLGTLSQPATRLVGALSAPGGQLARLLNERMSQLNAD